MLTLFDKLLFLDANVFSTLGAFDRSYVSLGGRLAGVFQKFFYNDTMDALGGIDVRLMFQAATAFSDRNNVVDDNVQILPKEFMSATLAVGSLDFYAQASLGYQYFFSQGSRLGFSLEGQLYKRHLEPWTTSINLNVRYSFGIVRGSYAQTGLSS